MGSKGRTLQVGQSVIQGSFEVKQNTTFTLYFAADYSATLIVMNSNNAQTFVNGGSVSYYDGFDGQYGINSFTLGPGSYSLGVRNKANVANTVSYELELWPPKDDATYVDTYFSKATSVSANGKLWQGFTIQAGYTYVMEGCNTGLDFFLIPASSLNAFTSNGTFSHYPDYSAESDPNQPGLATLNLAPGDYYLAFRNPDNEKKALVYALYVFQDSNSGGGGSSSGGSTSSGSSMSMDGSVGYSVSGSNLTMTVDSIVNSGNGTSGTLQLSLWATTSRYSGGELTGYILGESTLNPLSGGYHYTSVSRVTGFDPPPSGRSYYVTLILSEYRNNNFVIVDYRNFDNLYGSSAAPATTSAAEINLQTGALNFAVNAGSSGLLYLQTSLISQSPSIVFRIDEVTGWSGSSSGVASFVGNVITIPLLRVTGSSGTYSNVKFALSQSGNTYYLTLIGID